MLNTVRKTCCLVNKQSALHSPINLTLYMSLHDDMQYVTSRVASGEFPRYLYKYRPLYEHTASMPLLENTASILAKAQVWHPSPTTFNDPFDCQVALDVRRSSTIVRSVAKLIEKSREQVPMRRADRRRGFNNLRRQTPFTVARAQVWLRETLANIGVCSYGTRGDNLLMWAHYADSHRGVCFKFDVLADPAAYLDMKPVTYSRDYPVLSGLDEQSVSKALLVKADIWAYEEEFRVFTRTGPGGKAFAKSGLVEIIIGAKAAEDPVDALVDLLEADPDYGHVRLQQARLSTRSFSLEFGQY